MINKRTSLSYGRKMIRNMEGYAFYVVIYLWKYGSV